MQASEDRFVHVVQMLLGEVSAVAKRHDVSIANVAVRWALDQPAVAGDPLIRLDRRTCWSWRLSLLV